MQSTDYDPPYHDIFVIAVIDIIRLDINSSIRILSSIVSDGLSHMTRVACESSV